MQYEAVIGLEVHVQLKTRSKMFCGCSTEFGAAPNTQACPVCLGYPGVLPVMNEEAVRKTILTGLMFGSKVTEFSKWDRKNYFYPDMPKNYQISQYDLPLCRGGAVQIGNKAVGVTRIHLEEDVAKSFHFETTSGVDFNRAGTPLMEIVSEPDIRSPDEAFAYLTALKEILISGGVSDCDMEKGQLRCDANVSVRPVGQKGFGEKIEIKNMNTISGIRRALAYEVQRQTAALEKGEKLQQETRRWEEAAGKTLVMRTKEYAHDYRYFPEPDLMPVTVNDALLERVRKHLPELPEAKRRRFVKQYGLPEYDAGVLVASAALASYYERAAANSKNPKAISNWVMTELLARLAETKCDIGESPIAPERLTELVAAVDAGQISGKMAKDVFAEMFASGKSATTIIKERGLVQLSDTSAIEAFVDQAIAANPKSVADYRAGNAAAINFLKGQVMRLSQGKANPQLVGGILERKLKES
ncbi:MAG TPA: Asp-tRNA(Asn)/Glu-tRNA(Gln) amidotransferase subunit GatB [Verrucomicrobiae bacterium]|nr:Asp-tRNA(Asn)/Glu-tRNA(Gln) amidotransferase subunit GatB [Verrucomicrobiae bacterium]